MVEQGPQAVVVWTLDERRYGLGVAAVERVFPAVAIDPLPRAAHLECGSVNLRGQVVAVVNMRRCLKLPEREPVPSDRLLLAITPRRRLAFFVDAVEGVEECPAIEQQGTPGAARTAGMVELADGLMLIDNLEDLLSLADDACLMRG